jgi:hypothetical protein
MQLMLCNPSPRVVRHLERSGVLAKLGREHIFVRVHDAVVACQQSLIQMEAGGSLGPNAGPTLNSMWCPVKGPGGSGGGADGGSNGGSGGGGGGGAAAASNGAAAAEPVARHKQDVGALGRL